MITSEKRITVQATGEKIVEERQKVEIDVSVTTKKETHRSTVESEFLMNFSIPNQYDMKP